MRRDNPCNTLFGLPAWSRRWTAARASASNCAAAVAASYYTSPSHSPNEKLAWALAGKVDFFRRFLTGGSKLLGIASITLFILSTLDLIEVASFDIDSRTTTVGITFVSGGLFELLLSLFPKINRSVTPIYNGTLRFTENFLVKFASVMILLCGLEPISGTDRFLPALPCVLGKLYTTIIPISTALIIPHAITGMTEYKRYKRIASGNTSSSSSCYPTDLCNAPSNRRAYWDTLSNAAITALSMISLIATVSMILDVRDPSNAVPKIATIAYELAPAVVLSGFFGALSYRKKTSQDTKKLMFAFNQFVNPSLSNFYVAIYLTFSVLAAPVEFFTPLTTNLGYFFVALAYVSIPALNFLRAYEAYRFEYSIPQKIMAGRGGISTTSTPRRRGDQRGLLDVNAEDDHDASSDDASLAHS